MSPKKVNIKGMVIKLEPKPTVPPTRLARMVMIIKKKISIFLNETVRLSLDP